MADSRVTVYDMLDTIVDQDRSDGTLWAKVPKSWIVAIDIGDGRIAPVEKLYWDEDFKALVLSVDA